MDKNDSAFKISQTFFYTFARFEFALKVTGFLQSCRDAKPDWNKFAESIEPLFTNPQNGDFADAIKYFENQPPKKQINKDNTPIFEDAHCGQRMKSKCILLYIQRVRNNLFHGGKFKGRNFENPERSEELMKHSLVILKKCLDSNISLKEAFNSNK